MNRPKNIAVIILLLSCLEDLSASPVVSEKKFKDKEPAKSEIEGVWQTKCNSNLMSTVLVSFRGGNYLSNATQFQDPICKVPGFVVKAEGSFSVGNRKPNQRFNLDIKVSRVWLTVLSDKAEEKFSSEKFCGVAEWKKGQPVDIGKCSKSSMVGKTCYGQAEVKGNKFNNSMKSDNLDCTSDEKRFQKFDSENPFFRTELTLPLD